MAANEEKLVKMLRYVSEHNDFYKNRIKEYGITNPLDITQWPILTLSDIKNIQPTNNFSNEHEKVIYSSGSSGFTKKVSWTYKDYTKMCLYAWKLRNRWYNINPNMKTLHFYGSSLYNDIVDFQHNESDYYTLNNELFINYACLCNKISMAIDLINDFLPELMFAFPSTLMTLLEDSHEDKWRDNIRYIELYGECVNSDQIIKFKEKTPKAQYSIMYGTTETGVIAIMCPDMHMHIVEQNCFVECINEHLVLTSLVNTQTPYIRYFVNDIGIINYGECKCGLFSNTIVDLKGREPGFIITSNHKNVSATTILECLNLINAEYSCSIISYYAEQLLPGELNVYIDISKSYYTWKNTIISKLKSYLTHMVGGLNKINVDIGIPLKTKKKNYYTCRCCEDGKG